MHVGRARIERSSDIPNQFEDDASHDRRTGKKRIFSDHAAMMYSLGKSSILREPGRGGAVERM